MYGDLQVKKDVPVFSKDKNWNIYNYLFYKLYRSPGEAFNNEIASE